MNYILDEPLTLPLSHSPPHETIIISLHHALGAAASPALQTPARHELPFTQSCLHTHNRPFIDDLVYIVTRYHPH